MIHVTALARSAPGAVQLRLPDAYIQNVSWLTSNGSVRLKYGWYFHPTIYFGSRDGIEKVYLPSGTLPMSAASFDGPLRGTSAGTYGKAYDRKRTMRLDTYGCGKYYKTTYIQPPGLDVRCNCGGASSGDATNNSSCVGDPVNVTSGNVRYEETDPVPDGLITRTYNSYYGDQVFLFGKGWSSILDSRVQLVALTNGTSTATVGVGDGATFIFEGTTSSGFVQRWPANVVNASLRYESVSGQFVMHERGEDREYLFDGGSGLVAGWRSRSTARRFDVTRDAAGLVTGVVDSWGRTTLTVSQNGTTKLVDSIQLEGEPGLWRYSYNASNLVSVAHDSGGVTSTWRTYVYSPYLAEIRNAAGHLLEKHTYGSGGTGILTTGLSSLGPSGEITNIAYGGVGRNADESITTITTNGSTKQFYVRTQAGRLRVVETSEGCSSCGSSAVVLGYDALGHVVRRQDARGYLSLFTYDADGRVTSARTHYRRTDCDPASGADCRLTPDNILAADVVATAASVTKSYEYADTFWPERPTLIASTSVYPGNEKIERFTYHPVSGETLIVSTDGWTGDPLHLETRTVTTATYDGLEGAAFNPGGTFAPEWLLLPQPAHLRKSVDGPRTDLADVTGWVYYPIDTAVPSVLRGRLAATRNAAGHVTRFEAYDRFGTATRTIDPNGVITERMTDPLGRVTATTLLGVSGCDTSADPLCGTDLATTSTASPALGPVTSTLSAAGVLVQQSYDSRGRLQFVTRGPTMSDMRERIEYVYDSVTGKKKTERWLAWQNGAWSEKKREDFEYDTDGRLKTVRHPDNSVVRYTYTTSGDLKDVTDERHTTPNTVYQYDPAGRLSSVTQTLATASGGVITTSYAYDLHGNLVSVTDPNGNVTTYVYDDFGQMLRQTSPVTGVTTYAYDAAGNVVSSTDARGAVTTRAYDALARVTSATATLVSPETVTWAYDTAAPFGLGRLHTFTDAGGTTTLSYDRRGLTTAELREHLNGMVTSTSYRYDRDGNRIGVGYPSGAWAAYTFDFAGRPATLTYDGVPVVTGATYRPYGPALQLAFGNGTTRERTYDTRDRLTSNSLVAGAVTLLSHTYEHDTAGNVTAITDALSPSYSRTFGYDDVNRLTIANSGAALWGAGSYSYDAMGNMLASTLGATFRSFSYLGTTPKLASVNGSMVTYDAVGNDMTGGEQYDAWNRRTTGGFVYDGRGIRVQANGTILQGAVILPSSTTYTYTPEMQLLSSVQATREDGIAIGSWQRQETRDYLWFGGEPVGQVDIGPMGAIDEIPLEEPERTYRFTFTDHLGTPLAQTDLTGSVIWRAEYEPYGTIHAMHSGTATEQVLRFPGQDQEGSSPDYYNIFRWYRSGWGRYTQADPIGLAAHPNLYTYVGGSPTRYTDPSGLVTYQCRRPLGRLPGRNQRTFTDVPWNPFFHQYTCTTDASTGTLRCSSTAPTGSPRSSPGRPTTPATDYYHPDACRQTHENNKCFERCLIDEWTRPRPRYGIPFGIDCQEYDDAVNQNCRTKCGLD